ncbi:MAG: hypothetical protein RL414_392 [Actinomycetota bacterium]|jgi:hypothetical protein
MKHIFFAEAAARHLPAKPAFFGIFAFAVLSLFLYLVLRLDQD